MRAAAAFLLLAVLAGSCSKPASSPRHLALPPAENLSGDASLDWVTGAIPTLLVRQLEGRSGIEVTRVNSRRDAPAGSTPVLCRFSTLRGRFLLDCWRGGAEQELHSSGELNSGLADIVSPIGLGLEPTARPGVSVSNDALIAVAKGQFAEAARLAPDFGPIYTEGAARSLASGDRPQAEKLIADGLARGSAIGEISRARLTLIAANLASDRSDQVAALQKLTSLIPSDADQWTRYAQLLVATGKLTEAAAAQAKVVGLQPENQTAWNQLGYYRAYSGDISGAKQALDRYAQLSPNSPNALDSLGEVYYYGGRFAEAEKAFLDSMVKDGRFLGGLGYFKAAMARLRMGDKNTASEHFQKYVDANAAGKNVLNAAWTYISGDSASAETDMRNAAAAAKGELAAQAWSQVAFWAQLRGEETSARQAAMTALPQARSPMVRLGAQLAAFATQPDTSSEGWAERARKLISGPDPQHLAQTFFTYGLVLHRHYAEAERPARKALGRANPTDDRHIRVILAWILFEQGEKEKAAELLKVNPIPATLLAGPFDPVLLRKELDLRRELKLP